MRLTLSILILAGVTLVGCSSGPGPDADEGKTPEQVAEQIKESSKEELEVAKSAYQDVLDSLKTDSGKLDEQIAELSGNALAAVLGDDEKKKQAKDDLAQLESDLAELSDKMSDYGKKLAVYTKELASRDS